MIQDLKALVVVLGLSLPVWWFARRHFAQFSSLEVFDRRRNVWLAITVIAFVAPNIWIYAMFAVPIMVWAGQRDPNPAALCLLLFYAVPPASVPIPAFVINEFFNISHLRLLGFTVLLPAALAHHKASASRGRSGPDVMDVILLSFMALTIVLFVPYENITNSVRRTFLFALDTVLLFYVFSRVGPGISAIRDCLSTWLLAGLLLSPIAMFEMTRFWLLYVPIADRWGDPNVFAFLTRGSSLRAQASAGHSLALGYWFAMALGFFMLLQRYWQPRWARYALGLLMLGGLWATLSRGPWLTAFLFVVLFLLLNPHGATAAIKAIAGLTAVVLLVLLSPLGDRLINYLPFVGTVDSGNVEYRQQLIDVAWPLILQNPMGGNPDVMTQLESLRQGQGIIDLINGYIAVALFTGFGGLALFAGLLSLAALRALAAWFRLRRADPDAAHVAAALAAAMLATMFFIFTAGYGPTTYVLAGLCASCWHVARRASTSVDPLPNPPPLAPFATR
jgi:hypothetical protein